MQIMTDADWLTMVGQAVGLMGRAVEDRATIDRSNLPADEKQFLIASTRSRYASQILLLALPSDTK